MSQNNSQLNNQTGPVVGSVSSSQTAGQVSPSDFKSLQNITIGIAAVAAIGFITLVVQYFSDSRAAYQNMINQVHDQHTRIELLSDEISDLKEELRSNTDTPINDLTSDGKR